MDFGLAKMVEEVRRQATVIGGTPYYMAPEQAVGDAVDARADIYALGVTFFELLTGGVPFREGDVTYHHRHTPPPDPRTRAENIPEGFEELVLEMMAKTPAKRCASAAVVAARLAPFTAPGQPRRARASWRSSAPAALGGAGDEQQRPLISRRRIPPTSFPTVKPPAALTARVPDAEEDASSV
jgi:serine/threonine-protein kinase